MEKKISRFDIKDLLPIGLVFIVFGIAIAYGLDVMEDVQGDMTANGLAYNATQDAMDGTAKLPEKLPLIATVVVAAVIIGILVVYLARRFM